MARAKKDWGFPKWGGYGSASDPVRVRRCDYDGCGEEGLHPAPKSAYSGDRWYFCGPHAAEYNKGWNFFEGMSDDEAQTFSHDDKRTASGYASADTYAWAGVDDADGLTRLERDALGVLELDVEADGDAVKRQYRRLAKRFHPDSNRGDASAAEKFHRVQAAYDVLRARFRDNDR